VEAEIETILANCRPSDAPPFQVSFSGGCPGEYVNVGPDALKSIIGNLVDNAVRQLPPGGRLEVATASLGDQIVISIQDSGPGMSAEDWENYLRGSLHSSHMDGHGRGGLIAIILANLVGGWIEKIHNGPDGVRLDVRLPRAGSRAWPRR
jgi:signal transduction histidine kinase